jgi:ABC-2 type transport system permease protein
MFLQMYILWLRQIKRYYRSTPRMIGSLAQPLLFLFAFSFGFGPIFERAGGGDYLTFLVPGIIAMSIMMTSMFNGIEIIWDKQFGFLKETFVAPVSRFTIFAGRALGGATVSLFQGIVILLISFLVGFRPQNVSMTFLSFLFMFLVALLFTAIGTGIGSLLNDMSAFPLIMNFLIMPIFFLSGALFPLDGLPGFVDIISRLNPLSYGVDGIRLSLNQVTHFGFWTDFGILLVCISVLMVIGSYLFSKIQM